MEQLSYSVDTYFMSEILLLVHGIPTEEKAKDIVTILQDYKDYKIKEPVVIVSSENYKVVQIQKNLEAYIKSQSEVQAVKVHTPTATEKSPPTKTP